MFEFYDSIIKPPLSPPAWAFPVAWTLLYPLIFITYGYATYKIIKKKKDKKIIIFLAINLILNFAFTPVFSGLMEFGWGALIAALLLISTIYNTYLLNKINKKLALAQVPYIIWLCYALYLSVGVAILN